MTRIFTDGAEMRDILFWDNSYECTIGSTDPFESPYYYGIAAGGQRYACHVLPAAISECYMRARIRNTTNPGFYGLNLFLLRMGLVTIASVGAEDLNRLIARVGSATVDTSIQGYLLAMAWYLLEVYFKMADAPNGRFVVKIDGNIVIDFTGDTKPDANTTFDNFVFIASTSSELSIDDLAMNDTAGGVDDSWCGDGVVVKVTPDDNSATTNNWHGSDSDDVDNYLMVDEYPYDGDTTYVYRDGADSGTQQQFKMSDDYDGTNKTILRIFAEGRARKTSAVADTIKIGILASGGSDVMSGGLPLLAEGPYLRIVGPDELINPVDSATWEEADIDALEFVTEVG